MNFEAITIGLEYVSFKAESLKRELWPSSWYDGLFTILTADCTCNCQYHVLFRPISNRSQTWITMSHIQTDGLYISENKTKIYKNRYRNVFVGELEPISLLSGVGSHTLYSVERCRGMNSRVAQHGVPGFGRTDLIALKKYQ
jgi:hypothetical protein